jgi:hypothetical protein
MYEAWDDCETLFWLHLLFALYYLNYLIEGLVEDGNQLRHQPQQHDLRNHERCCEGILTYSLVYN